jgi:putative ABC transport system permease protein
VLWANLIAWPVAGWLMQRWLQGFAYHVDLPWWVFPLAGGAALLIALATVAMQARRTAGARPVATLRHE